MDSMRSLNKSLPSTSTAQPPELLLQAFKTAALSVTNLYKNAVSDQAQSRSLGYQDALEDLRAFLDKEKIGLSDGEGLRVRNWVMDKLDLTGSSSNDSDDDKADTEKANRSVSPTVNPKTTTSQTTTAPKSQPSQHSEVPSRQPSEPPTPHPPAISVEHIPIVPPRAAAFTFTAGPGLPSQEDIDMKTGMDNSSDSQMSNSLSSHPVRLELHSRPPRTPHRHGNGIRHNSRSMNRDPTPGAGSKRKFHFGDFFDISNLGNGRDPFGGPKRGRFL